MTKCVICCETLSTDPAEPRYDSAEHIFPNAVGGQKTVSGFICRKCNSETGETWDAALAKTMLPLSLMFGVKRDRGKLPSLRTITTEGEHLTLQAEGGLTLTHPEFKETRGPDGSAKYNIKTRSIPDGRKILKGLKKKIYDLDIEAVLAQGTPVEKYPDGDLGFQFQLGDPKSGRSMVKTALAFAFSKGIGWRECEQATAYLRHTSAKACFGFFSARDLLSDRKSGVPLHCVALRADPTTGLILSYVEYFGSIRIVACLGDKYAGLPVETAYAIDPRTAEELSTEVDLDFDPKMMDEIYAGGHLDGLKVEAAFSSVLGPTLRSQEAAERKRVVGRAVDRGFDECGAKEGEQLTPEHLQRISRSVAESVAPFLLHRMRSVRGPNKV